MSVLRRAPAAAVATAACVVLAACGEEFVTGTNEEPAGPALTAPGTALELGEAATVPIGRNGVARLVVTRIEEGRPADLEAFGQDARAAVSYVWMTVTRVSGDVGGFASYDHVHGWAGDDLVPHVLTDPRPYDPCPTRYFPDDGPVGVLETCTVFTSATPIDRVGFHDAGDYRRNAAEVVWR
ncbi:hypothetical protein [Nocardioides sp. 1609]|uniref:hypothetical protein n=1 Tax=Nocardioides sp. 1609 TaxID=2508327 RepID=UPI00106F8A6E|nr:hypothetical protein [Nocardioides sp. 1609]